MTSVWRNIMEKEWLRRAGVAVSIMAHVAFIGWLVFGSGVKLYESVPSAINVELVPSTDVPAQKPGDFSLPSLEASKDNSTDNSKDDSKADEPKAEESKQKETEKSVEKPATTPTPETPTPTAQPQTPPPDPSPLPQAAITGAPVVEPDVMSQYGDPFLSGMGGFTADTEAADLKQDVVAAFRSHLKSCLKLPEGVAPTDDARIVLRVALKPDGKLARPPTLMAAKATPKGPLIMEAAISALEACQPYSMLPADKYKEWRELDLEFTPAGF